MPKWKNSIKAIHTWLRNSITGVTTLFYPSPLFFSFFFHREEFSSICQVPLPDHFPKDELIPAHSFAFTHTFGLKPPAFILSFSVKQNWGWDTQQNRVGWHSLRYQHSWTLIECAEIQKQLCVYQNSKDMCLYASIVPHHTELTPGSTDGFVLDHNAFIWLRMFGFSVLIRIIVKGFLLVILVQNFFLYIKK